MKQQDLSNVNVLVVDDSKTQLMLIIESLKNSGASVIEATNGREALEKVRDNQPDVVVSDIEMPEMDGYELCKQIKDNKDTAKIPVILLTNLADPKDVIKGIECRANNFITKPCSIELLSSSITDTIINKTITKESIEKGFLEFSYHGDMYKLKTNNIQITDLLLSTYSSALEKNMELGKSNQKLSTMHLEMQKKNNQLSKLIEEKNLMLGMAAHDLRNPLNAIQTYSDIVMVKLDQHLDEKSRRMIEKIRQSSKYMLQLVNDMLDISVIEAGEMKMNMSECDLVEIAKKTCMINESIAEQKNMTLHFELDQNIPKINLDENKIEQVINNLLSNAIKFSPKGSKIEVSLFKEDGNAVVFVKDHGNGIPETERDNLFKTFGKTSVKGTAGEASTGLGLAIVKKIVAGHNGNIWVDSTVGEGSTFYFSLPI